MFLLTTLVFKQRGVPATVSSFYVSVPYTAMLRTSIGAVILGSFYFCPLDCDALVMVLDCAAVKTGCMRENTYLVPAKGRNRVRVHLYLLVEVLMLLLLLLLLPKTSVLKRRYYYFSFGGCAAAALYSSKGMC